MQAHSGYVVAARPEWGGYPYPFGPGGGYSGRVSGRRTSNEEAAACAAAARVCACLNLRRAARAVTRLFDATLAPSGLRSTQFVMLVSIQAEGTIGLPELARTIGLERSVLTRRLAPLVREGLVVKVPDKRGGATLVRLTPKGARRMRATVPHWEAAQRHLVGRLGSERWETMLEDLTAASRAAADKVPPARGADVE